MKELVLLLILFPIAHSVKNSLMLNLTISSGVPDVPEYVVVAKIDGITVVYYNSSMKAPEPRQVWVKKLIDKYPGRWKNGTQKCKEYYDVLKYETGIITKYSNQTGGVQIVEQIIGCEWDDETDLVDGYKKYSLNGEDFIAFDVKTETWISSNPLAESIKQKWDRNKDRNGYWKNLLTNDYVDVLKKYIKYVKNVLNRKDVTSVSLLQKTPSSPVSCHATGFYPDRAMMFWRKDGEEIHEGVEHGEILPNHDGSFQMNVDLDISSVSPEDWRRYDCVFHLSGVEDIVTNLDQPRILPRYSAFPTRIIVGGVVGGLLLLALCVTGIIIWRRNNKGFRPANSAENKTSTDETII
ncbi:major histocompatibility complex class I-related gene protein-like isoform X2 [Mugil cephalus]|uniref:major histocompatibility complex class I-related gene protein-like isoform X2 n=1 Tax=Mugil cephalus TaxID=48193 RepID=UPI001FB769FF|nr:major histocompatibility complex class I-related gene protein-like isoform X2 [Mugil cephalus]